MKFKIIGILILVATSGFTALGQYSKKDKKFFPKISPDAKVVLDLSSNIQNTRFVIDGKEVMKTKRIKVLINKGQHTVVATPDGYISKEDYLQPPYFNDQATLRFTFLLEDKIERQGDVAVSDEEINKSAPIEVKEAVIISDVDLDIPKTNKIHPNRYALVIGNEDYKSYQMDLSSEVNVDYAVSDSKIFKEYALATLGIPSNNVFHLVNATAGQMKQALAKMNKIAEKSSGTADIFFYYAGHGLPDEVTKDAYLIPVDVSGTNIDYGVKVNDVYKQLTQYPSKRVTVFFDACFSGGARNQGLLATRGVKIKPKEEVLKGKLIVFSASSGEQSSLAYNDQGHGMFSYYLFKKMKESGGDLMYKDLANYLVDKVGLNSVLINSKEQDPQVNVSPEAIGEWEQWKFN